MFTCPSCGRENTPGSRFCSTCGTALAGDARSRKERKVVSVLFCDLVGFTAESEARDPEDVEATLSRYHRQLRTELERHGGTVEKFIGDAVMAVFGAPTAHEDDPERAVRAALAIRDGIADSESHVRIGITTGEVVVSLAADPRAGEGIVAGDVVNTAARLEAAASTDTILVDQATFRATDRVIRYRERRPVRAKGKSQALRVWEAVEARARFGVDVAQFARAPLVGREVEFDALVDALSRARTRREPQLVTLVGVPGIGKSRLVWELFRHVDAEKQFVTWRQGRSLPYGDGVSFWALGEIVKAQAGVLESDSAEVATEKLGQSIAKLLADEGERAWLEAHLRPLLGLGEEHTLHPERQREAFAAWRRFLEAVAEQAPAVLVFEDLHWADDALLDFVDELLEWLSDVPLLVVATARPELLTRRPGWAGGKANALTLSLAALAENEVVELVQALVDQPLAITADQRTLVERAEGNPLYAEEFARLAVERGEDITLPDTVQGMIAARLDTLSGEEKQVLQNAAVIGKVFWTGGAEALTGMPRWTLEELLHGLERKEFVRRQRRSSVGGESEYSFRHALIRDVAYRQLPRRDRAEKHEAAAAWLESLGRPEDHAELLAHHHVAAYEFAEAAGRANDDLAERARRSLVAAGERSAAVTAFSSAVRHYQRALELSAAEDPERPLLLFAFAGALHALGDKRQTQALQEAKAALLTVGDKARAADVEAMLAAAAWLHGRRDDAAAHVKQALSLAHESKSQPATARVLAEAARQRLVAGDWNAAIKLGREALELAERAGLGELRADNLVTIGTARGRSGDAGGIAEVEEGLSRAVATNSLATAMRAYNNLAILVVELQGDFHRGRTLIEGGLELAERVGDRELSRFNRISLARYQYTAGEWDTALEAADALIAECEAGSIHLKESDARVMRAQIRGARGDVDGALEDIERALTHGRETESAEEHCATLSECIKLSVQLGRFEKAKALVEDLVADEPGTDHGLLSPEFALVAEELGVLDLVRRKLAETDVEHVTRAVTRPIADGRLVEAADAATGHEHRALAADIRFRASRALAEEGEQRLAKEQIDQALAFYRSVGATQYIRESEELLERLRQPTAKQHVQLDVTE